jgi:rhodanese-related sulfurtransferase
MPERDSQMQEMLPREAYRFLAENPEALFIDCRSDAEFYFVGHPVGANHVAWQDGPDWELNPHFVGEVRMLAGHSVDRPIVLICRSGKRSAAAAQALEAAGFTNTINVVHGFEGDLDEKHQRGNLNGWRHDGLPWEQL